MTKENLEFSVDSSLLGELGERLVTKNYLALAELIRNSYDADSKKITIHFINSKKKKGRGREIRVIDDGHGMIADQVKDYWMRIATQNKVRNPVSIKYGRKKTGNKGIGRFACRRLAKELVLISIAEDIKTKKLFRTKVVFKWKEFEPGTLLTEIPVESHTREIKKGKIGLTLKLIDLVDAWSDYEFNLLRRQLLTLPIVQGIKRKGYEEDPGFQIIFKALEFPKGGGELIEKYLNAGWGKLEGEVKNKGSVSLKLEAKAIGKKTYTLEKKFKKIPNVKFEIGWISTKKKYFRNPKLLTAGLAELIREQGGIRVYYDNFRIYPYGNQDDDWLGIDRDVARRWSPADEQYDFLASSLGINRSRAMLSHPSNRHLLGRVFISSNESTTFKIKADREGFLQNKAFDELVEVIRISLQWMVLYYNKFLLKFETKELRKAENELREQLKLIHKEKINIEAIPKPIVEKAVDVLSEEAERTLRILPQREKEETKARIQAATEVIHRTISSADAYLNILRAVASTGALMFVFSHEIKSLISRLDTHANSLTIISEDLSQNKKKQFEKISESLKQTRDRLDQQIKIFGILTKKTRDLRRKKIPILKTCKEIANGFEYLITHYDLKTPEYNISPSLKTNPMLESEFFSIFVNIFSNAIKANIAGGGNRILIQGERERNKTILRVYDNGIGLSKKYRNEVFEPLTADPEGKMYIKLVEKIQDKDIESLGRGSGLGLNIVKGIVDTYNGDVKFITPKPPWKTIIEVVLP